MRAHVYQIECLTNLHVGNGDVNYSIIDNQVERDPVTDNPTIHSSGVKGALREYCESSGIGKEIINRVFGSSDGNTSAGEYKFLSANLISRPLRVSGGEGSHVHATTPEIIKHYFTFCDNFGVSVEKTSVDLGNDFFISGSKVDAIEGYKCRRAEPDPVLEKLAGKYWAVAREEVLREMDLPVLARNCLDEYGISKNLWYEEIVPHGSRFWFAILTPEEVNVLDEILVGKVVQFGGNASIGYGYCKITKAGESHE